MASTKKIYKTIIRYEVLSEEPFGSKSLSDIEYETNEGSMSGRFLDNEVHDVILSGKEAVVAIVNQGSDPEFFDLDSDGNDID